MAKASQRKTVGFTVGLGRNRELRNRALFVLMVSDMVDMYCGRDCVKEMLNLKNHITFRTHSFTWRVEVATLVLVDAVA